MATNSPSGQGNRNHGPGEQSGFPCIGCTTPGERTRRTIGYLGLSGSDLIGNTLGVIQRSLGVIQRCHIYIYLFVYLFMYMYVCMYVCMYVRICMYRHTLCICPCNLRSLMGKNEITHYCHIKEEIMWSNQTPCQSHTAILCTRLAACNNRTARRIQP